MYKDYLNEIYRNLGYLAVWAPTVPVQIGDIGTIEGNRYRRISSLENLGVAFRVRKDDTAANYAYSTEGAVSITLKAAGDLPVEGCHIVQGDAGVTIRFGRQDAIVFHAAGCKSDQIDNLTDVAREIEWRYERDEWPAEQFVVTEVVHADTATIIISSGSGAAVELRANADVQFANLSLANSQAGLEVLHSSKVGFSAIATEGLTPLFSASGMKRRWFRRPQFRSRGKEPESRTVRPGQQTEAQISFGAITPDDL